MRSLLHDQAREKVRHHFIWILNLKKKEKKWEVEIHVRELEFKIELISHNTCKVEYDKNVENFLINNRTTCSSLNVLKIHSYTTTAQLNQSFTLKQLSIYIRERKLRNDSFEEIDKVINVSIDAIYARQKFYESQWEKSKKRKKQQKKNDWIEFAERFALWERIRM